MSQFQAGDRVRIKDRPGWPGGYKLGGWEGRIAEVKEDPKGYVVMVADKTGYRMAFPEHELEQLES